MSNAAFPWLEKEGEAGFGAPSNCLGAERQDEAPRHGLPGEREDKRKGKRRSLPSVAWLVHCWRGRWMNVCVDGKESW